ncbi:hypothetical protein TWF696_005130 [Orbilia brochopaga]|uniref:Aminoglycoside phosphotransferase domain-containing protein n=1 Tax=Orbilia brochopaga TaxID=3140254 RepID=A0AAV9V240_9PEZI
MYKETITADFTVRASNGRGVAETEDQTLRNCLRGTRKEYSGSPPAPKWFTARGHFQVPPSESGWFSREEAKERRRCSRIDFSRRNQQYIVDLCQAARGGLWKCQVDETAKFMVGCRNYIVQLVFEDGVRWLLKTSQPNLKWSKYSDSPGILNLEIATTLWLRHNTSLPVPRVRLWDVRTNQQNKFGKPWYVMEAVPGKTVDDQVKAATVRDKNFNWEKEQSKRYRHLAKFELESLRYPAPCRGRLILNAKASYFHAGRQKLPLDQIEISEKDDGCGLANSMIQKLDLNSNVLKAKVDELEFEKQEIDAHVALSDHLKEVLPKIIDKRFEKTYCLVHGDITDANILCDSKFYTTAIIDWELAKIVPLQLAVAKPGIDFNDLVRQVGDIFQKATVRGKVDYAKVSKLWSEHDKTVRHQRNKFIEEVSKLDDSVMGDGKTPWTAGYKYVTGLYRLSHAIQTIWQFLSGYEDFLELETEPSMFILGEIRRLAEGATKMVSEGILSRENEDGLLDELRYQV